MKDKNTKELLNILKNTSSKTLLQETLLADNFPEMKMSFAEYFMSLTQNIDRTHIVSKSEIERTYCYQILNGIRQPGRDKVIALCITAELSLETTNRCLTLAKHSSIYAKNRRDAIIIFAIEKKLSVKQTNDLLIELEEPILD